MQDKYRLYRRSNRAQGTFYGENRDTGVRESLGTKSKPEAEKLLRAKNEAAIQSAFNREMAKVYIRAQDPEFCNRTWQDVATFTDAAYEGPRKTLRQVCDERADGRAQENQTHQHHGRRYARGPDPRARACS